MPNNYILLETIALTQSAASVTFDNLPTSGYTDLKVVISSRTNRANAVDSLGFYFNGDTTVARYTGRVLYGTGTAVASNAPSPVNDETMFTSGNSATASTFGNAELYIPNYRSSNQKSVSIDSVGENNATTARMNIAAVLYDQTTAISSITFIPITGTTILADSTFSLYGIAALGITPVLAPKATGGNIVANDGTYWYHAFTSSGNFVPQVGLTADVLVVAGGAGGNRNNGGGGGAGGVLGFASQALTAINHNVTVGSGGSAGAGTVGGNGTNSQFASLTASVGGGAGAARGIGVAVTGGSGGGGASDSTSRNLGATGTTGQGNAGGNGVDGGDFRGGGGGGAGAAGNAAGANGNGGAGTNSVTNWGALSAVLTATNLGVSGYIAGGGGAGANYNFTSVGGSGGGGSGGRLDNTSNGVAGTANTGSGGGSCASGQTAGAGASGIVIVRYPIN
jgi:hypothetical protein